MSATDIIAALPPDSRVVVTQILDELSRPLTVREIDHALAPHFTRTQRKPLIRALRGKFDIIALVPRK